MSKEKNHLLPSITVLTIRGMKSKLPDDFGVLLSIELKRKTNTSLLNINPAEKIKFTHNPFADDRFFCIRENEIYFTGSYSKNIFIRWIQKLKEKFFPERAFLKYVNMQTIIEHDNKQRMMYLSHLW